MHQHRVQEAVSREDGAGKERRANMRRGTRNGNL